MAQDIIQKLGFDASSAIAEITRLKGAMASLNSATEGLANKVNSFDATQANKGFGELQKGAKDAEKGFKDLTISWKTLLRVVTTRVALGAFNKLTEALKEGTQAAITFGIRIAEIGTIAGKGIDLSNIRKEILDISSLTGRDAADVAEGYYQTLSNQVGDATESLYVFKQAAKLSIATNSSLGDSVNLLTAALNGWQMSAYEARNATNQLFKIIELGRVRVKDLANILGSVGPMAAKLGVNFGELGGSLSHITVQGVRANKTITQLRAIMTGLLKPSNDLIELMNKKWGVQNAEQAIKLFGGLAGVLKAIQAETGGASDKLAKFFPNVRAITGVFALISDMAKTEETIDAVTNAVEGINEQGKKLIAWASQLVLDTPAKKAERAFNDLKLAMMEAGNTLIPFATTGAKALEALSHAMGLIAGAAATAGLVFLINKIWLIVEAASAAKLAIIGMRLALVGAGAGLFVVGFAIGEFIQYIARAEERMIDLVIATKDATKAQSEFEDQLRAELGAEEEKRWKKAETAMVQYFAMEQLRYQKTLDKLKEINEVTTRYAKRRFTDLLDVQRKFTNALARQEDKQTKRSQKAQKSAIDVKRTLDQKQFEWDIENLADSKQAKLQIERAGAGLKQVKRLERTAITPKQFKAAREILRLSMADAVAAERKAESIDNLATRERMRDKARAMQIKLHKQDIALSGHEEAISKRLAKQAGKRTEYQKTNLEKIERLTKVILKSQLRVTKTGVKPQSQIEEERKAAEKAMSELLELSDDKHLKEIFDASRLFGLENLGARLTASLTRIPPLKVKLEADYAEFKSRLEAASKVIPIEFRAILNVLGAGIDDFTSPAEQAAKISTLTEKQIKLNEKLAQTYGASAASKKMAENVEPFKSREFTDGPLETRPDVEKMRDLYTSIVSDSQKVKELKFIPDTMDQDIKFVVELMAKLTKLDQLRAKLTGKWGVGTAQMERDFGFRLESEIKKLQLQLAATQATAKEAKKKQIKPEALGPAQSSKRLMDEVLNHPSFKKIEAVKFTAAEDSAYKLASTVFPEIKTAKFESAETSMRLLNSGAQSVKQIIESITIPTPQAPTPTASGEVQHKAKGGFIPRGTDTVPAMLTPGEFVINARSTRRFYSELVSMNAGRQPIYRAQGGSVTNQTIGDIHVSVRGGATSEKTVREIGPALRRELRRNTLKLR